MAAAQAGPRLGEGGAADTDWTAIAALYAGIRPERGEEKQQGDA